MGDESPTDGFCEFGSVTIPEMYVIAKAQAAQVGVRRDDIDDFSTEFLEWMVETGAYILSVWLQRERSVRHVTKKDVVAWLHGCAKNRAKQFRRNAEARSRREAPWTEVRACGGKQYAGVTLLLWEAGQDPADPEAVLYRKEFWNVMRNAIDALPAGSRELLIGMYIDEQSIATLAAICQLTPEAVKQRLYRARKSVATTLTREGFDEAKARSYLAIA